MTHLVRRRVRPCRRTARSRGSWTVLVAGLAVLLGVSPSPAHTPTVDANLSDWCVGAFSNTFQGGGRTEDSGVALSCGRCSLGANRACVVNTDCSMFGQGTCTMPGSKEETAWWDNRTDGAVNDLATIAITQDANNLYVAAELWVDPDPVSLPFGEVAIDFAPGGLQVWHDPNDAMGQPGRCSSSMDRGCTRNEDCHFCSMENEPLTPRPRTCGSGCDPDIIGNFCNTSQTCTNPGAGGPRQGIGVFSDPAEGADFLLVFDFSRWLTSAGDAVQLMQPGTVIDPTSPWDPVMGCTPDFIGDTTACDYPPAVNPGASGGSGGPPGSVEVAIPWSTFPPGTLGPGEPFRYTIVVVRGELTLDFRPNGEHEDLMSEPVAQTTSTTTTSCPGMGLTTTLCELADGSSDSLILRTPALPHEIQPGGRIAGLTVTKATAPMITLDWGASCSSADTSFAVYEGTIGGTFTSHAPVLCDTGGAQTATFTPGAGSTYYLIVPHDGSSEGSYGARTPAPMERPPSASACFPQVLGDCI